MGYRVPSSPVDEIKIWRSLIKGLRHIHISPEDSIILEGSIEKRGEAVLRYKKSICFKIRAFTSILLQLH